MTGSNFCLFLSILSLVLLFLSSLDTFASPTQHLCRHDQKVALQDFRDEFRIQKPAFVNPYVDLLMNVTCYPKTASWRNDSDCCSWDGVRCDAESGVVIGLDLSSSCLYGPLRPDSRLFSLNHLQNLNLAHNNFNSSSIPTEIGKLSSLTQLNLSSSVFSGQIPTELLQLTMLVSLDLSRIPPRLLQLTKYVSFDTTTSGVPTELLQLTKSVSLDLSPWISHDLFAEKSFLGILSRNLTDLSDLRLSYVNISSTVPKDFVNVSSLKSLHLEDCNLFGEFPTGVFLMPNIQSISLFNNANLRVSLPEFHTNSSIVMLDLSSTSFSGKLPDSISNLTLLSMLDLSYNNLESEVPSSIAKLNRLARLSLRNNKLSGNFPLLLLNLTELSHIDLSYNQFKGQFPSDMSSLSKLEFFLVTGNSFVGTLPLSLFMIPSLSILDLRGNQFSGPLEFGSIPSSSKLMSLYLAENNFNGSIPNSISKLANLMYLDLSYLNMSGPIDLNIFSHLQSLKVLFISGNSVSIANVSSTSNPPFHLWALYLSACNISGIPDFLRTQRDLWNLDLSSNRIKGQLPKWLWRLPKLYDLNLANNSLASLEGSPKVLRATQIHILDLSSNAFQGPFPVPPLSTKYLFASENNFSGQIPQTICKLSSLEILDLSSNNFRGSIPPCLGHFSDSLSVLNLRNNNLTGSLPETFTSQSQLRTLDVSHNQLTGKLPQSLINCTRLEILNVESNKINDAFPFWLEALPELQVLILRLNGFHGPLSLTSVSFGFSKLRIIDISHNNFTGTIPPDFFANWRAMTSIKTDGDLPQLKYMGDDSGYYQDSVRLTNKGLVMELVRILTIFTAIDFSGNKLEGHIPESIGLLNTLIVLNLSNNAFTGHILPSLVNLTELESLDLSRNRLSGKIPPKLGSLSSLGRINFSHNQLTGPIPQGAQFQTQNSSSFEGNLGLCGLPLERSCGDVNTPTSQQVQQSESEEEIVNWTAAAIGYAPGLVLGLTIGYVMTSYKHDRFMKILGRNRRRQRRMPQNLASFSSSLPSTSSSNSHGGNPVAEAAYSSSSCRKQKGLYSKGIF